MQKTSHSPASALRKPRNIVQTPSSATLKKSPVVVAAARRTSSGRDLHDQLRKSPSASPQGMNSLTRGPDHTVSSSTTMSDDTIPRKTGVTFSPAPAKVRLHVLACWID